MLQEFRIQRIREHGELAEGAAEWFHGKWAVPKEAYLESLEVCLRQGAGVPQWYLALYGPSIVGGLGVIENDFHNRRDLAPNICAVYVEPDYRRQGIAGKMLDFACRDMAAMGVETLYLVTDHTSFYERYGWEFYCMAEEEKTKEQTRLYVHRMKAGLEGKHLEK